MPTIFFQSLQDEMDSNKLQSWVILQPSGRDRWKCLILSAVEADRGDQESPTPSIKSSTS
jgi:hypothetical protein